jgi:hypothetical protein
MGQPLEVERKWVKGGRKIGELEEGQGGKWRAQQMGRRGEKNKGLGGEKDGHEIEIEDGVGCGS